MGSFFRLGIFQNQEYLMRCSKLLCLHVRYGAHRPSGARSWWEWLIRRNRELTIVVTKEHGHRVGRSSHFPRVSRSPVFYVHFFNFQILASMKRVTVWGLRKSRSHMQFVCRLSETPALAAVCWRVGDTGVLRLSADLSFSTYSIWDFGNNLKDTISHNVSAFFLLLSPISFLCSFLLSFLPFMESS